MTYDKPEERVGFSTKMQPSWYKNNIEYWIGLAISLNNKNETQDNIDAANGIVPQDTYKYIMQPLSAGNDSKTLKNLPGQIRSTDFITPIREKNLGEFAQLPSDFTVKVDDPEFRMLRNKDVADQVKPIIEQAIINEINKTQDTGIDSAESLDIKKVADDAIENWFDERAIKAHNLVVGVNNNNDYDNKRLSWFNDWWSTEELYIHIFDKNNEIFYEDISPMEGYPISNGYDYVEDHEAFVINRYISIDRIKEMYDDDLTVKDLKYLESLIEAPMGSSYGVRVEVYEDIHGTRIMGNNNSNTTHNDVVTFSNTRDAHEYIVYFKTDVKRSILLYFNKLGEIKQKVVDNDFKLNISQGHIIIEKKWISETWKQVRLGDKDGGIYLKPKVLEIQLYDAKGHNKLPIIGKKGLLKGTYINPIPKRIIPNLALSQILTLQIERQMAKYKGTIEIIPQSLLKSDKNQDAKGNMLYKMMDNTIIYNDQDIDYNLVSQGYRLVGDDSSSTYIRTLIDYRTIIKDEAWDMANMNDSRYGNAAPSSTVTNNQQNIFNAKLGSVLMVNIFNSIMVRLFTYALEFAKHVYVAGKSGSIFNEDGTITYYNLNSGELTDMQLGIFMTNAVADFDKLRKYEELAFSAGQNGNFGLALEAIEGKSPSALRKTLKDFAKSQADYDKQIKQQELQQAQAISDAQIKNDEANRNAKVNEIETKENIITDREVTLAEMDNNNNNDK